MGDLPQNVDSYRKPGKKSTVGCISPRESEKKTNSMIPTASVSMSAATVVKILTISFVFFGGGHLFGPRKAFLPNNVDGKWRGEGNPMRFPSIPSAWRHALNRNVTAAKIVWFCAADEVVGESANTALRCFSKKVERILHTLCTWAIKSWWRRSGSEKLRFFRFFFENFHFFDFLPKNAA